MYDNWLLLDGKWKDLYYVGSSQRIVGWKHIWWSTRFNPSSFWASLCSDKWGKLMLPLYWSMHWILHHTSASSSRWNFSLQEQIKNADRQLKYQCHCSFLEVDCLLLLYLFRSDLPNLLISCINLISDFSDLQRTNYRFIGSSSKKSPGKKDYFTFLFRISSYSTTYKVFYRLFFPQIREDVKSGIYVENLTEECVRTMSDVKQLLMKVCFNNATWTATIVWFVELWKFSWIILKENLSCVASRSLPSTFFDQPSWLSLLEHHMVMIIFRLLLIS